MSDAIQAAIDAAQREAENTPSSDTAAQSGAVTTTGAAGLPAQGGAPRSLDDFLANAGMNAECYLGVSELGIRFGKDTKLHEEIEATMNLGDAKFGFSLRFNGPQGVSYLTSWDGVTEARSRQNWTAVQAEVKKIDPKAYVSDLVEIPVVLLKDYQRKEGGAIKAGTVVGLSLNYMKAKAFGPWLKEQYPIRQREPFDVKIGYAGKKGSGQDYGVFTFEVIEPKTSGAGGKKAA